MRRTRAVAIRSQAVSALSTELQRSRSETGRLLESADSARFRHHSARFSAESISMTSNSCNSCRIRESLLRQQELLHEEDRGIELEVAVGLLGEAVALVLCHHVPDGRADPPDALDHLLGLRHRHARIVGALDHE